MRDSGLGEALEVIAADVSLDVLPLRAVKSALAMQWPLWARIPVVPRL
jgi:hypothetical protein